LLSQNTSRETAEWMPVIILPQKDRDDNSFFHGPAPRAVGADHRAPDVGRSLACFAAAILSTREEPFSSVSSSKISVRFGCACLPPVLTS